MPKYKVLQKSFINNRICEEGDIVEYEGDVSENLELVKKGKAKAESSESEASEE